MAKRALVTGNKGFVGRHMQAELERRGWMVHGVDIRDDAWPEYSNNAHFIFSQDVDRNRGDNITRYSLVVHCAAESPNRGAIDTNPSLFPANVALDAAMFRWAIRTNQPHVLYFSSSAAYPIVYQRSGGGRALVEDDIDLDGMCGCSMDCCGIEREAMTPDSPYGWTKLLGEQMAAAAREAGVKVTVVRPFSGYGEDQSPEFPFGAFIRRAKAREDPFTIWGTGDQVRDWIHIDDMVKGALAVVESGTTDPVNLCTGIGTDMKTLARMICEAAGYMPGFQIRPGHHPGVRYRVGVPWRMRQYHHHEVSLEEGIRRAIGG